jgi:membrane protein
MNISGLSESWPGRFLRKLGQDNAFNWAVILAWNFLQSLFPMVLVMAAILGLVLGFIGVGSDQVYLTVLSIIPDAVAQREAFSALQFFHQKSGIFFLIGFAGLIWTGSGLFRSMEQAFAVIYKTKQRPLPRGLLMSVGMVFLFTLFAGLMLVTSFLLGLLDKLPFLPGVLHNGTAAFMLQFLIGLAAGFLLFLCIYRVVPNRHQHWGKVWPGAAAAGLLFELLSLLFPLYLRLTGGGSAYGKTFALLFLLMIYFYFLGIVTMVGAEINSLLYPAEVGATEPVPEPVAKPKRPSRLKGIAALGVLWAMGALRGRRRAA